MIRGTVVVVLTTITIATLKVFDIVRTMTGGNFQTNVIANEMYSQAFRQLNYGQGSHSCGHPVSRPSCPLFGTTCDNYGSRGRSDNGDSHQREN
jgi:hypothetical protein